MIRLAMQTWLARGNAGVLWPATWLVVAFSWACCGTAAELIPAARVVDWTPGATAAQPAIMQAIAKAADSDVVYLPAGTYRAETFPHMEIDASSGNVFAYNSCDDRGVPGGFQELDPDVKATTLLKGNYNYKDNGAPASESLHGATLPKSLYLKERPAWFGDLRWPAFGPDTDFQNNKIPAQVRFEAMK